MTVKGDSSCAVLCHELSMDDQIPCVQQAYKADISKLLWGKTGVSPLNLTLTCPFLSLASRILSIKSRSIFSFLALPCLQDALM